MLHYVMLAKNLIEIDQKPKFVCHPFT